MAGKSIKFTVPGEPKGKGRPRFGKSGVTHTPTQTVNYETLVKMEYQSKYGTFRFPDDAPIDARLMVYYPIPKSASKKKQEMMRNHQLRPMKKPDLDNVCKMILDALNYIAYRDDTQIVDCQIRKFYSDNPRVVVTLTELEVEQ